MSSRECSVYTVIGVSMITLVKGQYPIITASCRAGSHHHHHMHDARNIIFSGIYQ